VTWQGWETSGAVKTPELLMLPAVTPQEKLGGVGAPCTL
jgi:hypothetical protein